MISFNYPLYANDDLALSVSKTASLKLLHQLIKASTTQNYEKVISIDPMTYNFSFPLSEINENTLVQQVTPFLKTNLVSENLRFQLKTSTTSVASSIDKDSLNVNIMESRSPFNEIGFSLSFDVSRVEFGAESMRLCERFCGGRNPNKVIVNNIEISTQKSFKVILKMKMMRQKSSLKMKLISLDIPELMQQKFNIDFDEPILPPMTLLVDGERVELNFQVREKLLEQKDLFSQKMMAIVQKYIANDVVQLMNNYLDTWSQSPAHELYCLEKNKPYVENVSPPRDNTLVSREYISRPQVAAKKITDQLFEIIDSVKVDVSLQKIMSNQSGITFVSDLEMMLNTSSYSSRINEGLSSILLPSRFNSDIGISLKRSYINHFFKRAREMNFLKQLNQILIGQKELDIEGVEVQFEKNNTLVLIMNLSIDLKKVSSRSLQDWIKNKAGVFLERHNNNSRIIFPLQIPLRINFENQSSRTSLVAQVGRIFDDTGEPFNTYMKRSNLNKVHPIVKKAVLEEIRNQLQEFEEEFYEIDVTQYFKHQNIEFVPRIIETSNEKGLLHIGLDLKRIRFE